MWRKVSVEVGLPGISLLVVWLKDLTQSSEFRLYDVVIWASSGPFIESNHRETSLFWAHTDVVGQVNSVYVYLLLTVTSHRFTSWNRRTGALQLRVNTWSWCLASGGAGSCSHPEDYGEMPGCCASNASKNQLVWVTQGEYLAWMHHNCHTGATKVQKALTNPSWS